MRRFKVYLEYGYAGCPPEEVIVEFPDDASEQEIEETLKSVWDTMIGNMDSGWYELDRNEDD